MKNSETNRIPVITWIGNAMFVGEKTIENNVVKTTYDFLDHILMVIDQGNEKEYYYDKISLPVNNLEDAVRLCCGHKKFSVHAVVEGIVVDEKYSNLNEAMKRALDFMEHGEPVSIIDANGSSYDPVKYWYET